VPNGQKIRVQDQNDKQAQKSTITGEFGINAHGSMKLSDA